MNSCKNIVQVLSTFRIIALSVVVAALASCTQLYVADSSNEQGGEPAELDVPVNIEEVSQGSTQSRDEVSSAQEERVSDSQDLIDLEQEINQAIQTSESRQVAESIDNPEELISLSENESWRLEEETISQKQSVFSFCEEVGGKLGSVDVEECLVQELRYAGTYTANNRPMAVRDFFPEGPVEGKTRVLIIGGIHGDEYSSISIMFKWMALLQENPMPNFFWRFAPSVNPDGLLEGTAVRQNSNGVDLNRNFPSKDWDDDAQKYWKNSTGSNPRRYPGDSASSEIEVQWIVNQIETFKPDVIMSVHAPYHLLDFDGPSEPPTRIGELYLHVLGVYPGSLGNYAGIDLDMPVVTLELPAAGIMPDDYQIKSMWTDIQTWLRDSY